MSTEKNLKEFKADHSGGVNVPGAEVPDPIVPAGGTIKRKLADLHKEVDPKPKKLATKTPGEDGDEENEIKEMFDITEAFESLFPGTEFTEETATKFKLIFEAAVNEASTSKIEEIVSSLEEDFEEKLSNTVDEIMEELTENLDSYLDYIVKEWMEENEIAIESGIKVEMAESLMEGLRELFNEHNIEIDESDLDVLSDLEEELDELKEQTNEIINENIQLKEELQEIKAEFIFAEIAEDLTVSQEEKFRILAEKLDVSDLDSYKNDLRTIKESFFKKKFVSERTDSGISEMLLEEGTAKPQTSQYDIVNALAKAMPKR
jgi:hypothetical protein